jgi:hypothetical protein
MPPSALSARSPDQRELRLSVVASEGPPLLCPAINHSQEMDLIEWQKREPTKRLSPAPETNSNRAHIYRKMSG